MTKKQISSSLNKKILTYEKLPNWAKYTFISVIILIFLLLYILSFGFQSFFQQLVNGIQLGSIYALIALGYTMIYGIIKLINFAHGDLFMFGAYISCFLGNYLIAHNVGFPFIIVLIFSMTVTALLGMIIEKIAYKPLRFKPRLAALITALGVSLFLENFFALSPQNVPFPLNKIVFGPKFIPFPALIVEKTFNISGITINNIKILDVAVTIILMMALQYVVKKTMIGKAMRAVAFNKDACLMMGININNIISITFGIGISLAAASGTLYALTYGQLQSPYLGIWPGLKAFIAAVLGGIGSIPGAMLGSYVMGISETFATSINSNFGYGIAFIILIVVLVFRPAGLLGKFTKEKV
ncbi:MAG TPA: branched-chain amino acid ABC transporter permease [Candidatus Atribacteria bacterium]|nr:branched-chain amino acid ABC transporter permease [Candidatus Atribacteria bacterium]